MFTLLNADCSNQNWLTIGITFNDFFDDCIKFGIFSFENQVGSIFTHDDTVCRDWHHLQVIGVHQLSRFSLRGSGHA